MGARDTLLDTIGASLAFLRAQAGAVDSASLDFDMLRRLQIEEITGVLDEGIPMHTYGRLSEGSEASIARLEELKERMRSALEAIEAFPGQYGVSLRDTDA